MARASSTSPHRRVQQVVSGRSIGDKRRKMPQQCSEWTETRIENGTDDVVVVEEVVVAGRAPITCAEREMEAISD